MGAPETCDNCNQLCNSDPEMEGDSEMHLTGTTGPGVNFH